MALSYGKQLPGLQGQPSDNNKRPRTAGKLQHPAARAPEQWRLEVIPPEPRYSGVLMALIRDGPQEAGEAHRLHAALAEAAAVVPRKARHATPHEVDRQLCVAELAGKILKVPTPQKGRYQGAAARQNARLAASQKVIHERVVPAEPRNRSTHEPPGAAWWTAGAPVFTPPRAAAHAGASRLARLGPSLAVGHSGASDGLPKSPTLR
eukprot:scaffold34556_cov129-Isochrysis_galbana.AAC.4